MTGDAQIGRTPQDAGPNGTPRLLMEGLQKSFGGRPVLRGIDLCVPKGESLVILGASGGGKSVLLKHIIGLLKPDKGRVVIDGQDMTGADGRAWREVRRRFGMSFQEGALFDSMSVFENVAFPLRRHTTLANDAIAKRVSECLAMVELEKGVAAKMPNELSGGMRRRVGFARAIANRPEILLFDEPNTGLDPITSAVIDHDIEVMRRETGATMVIITHDTKSAFRIGTRIAMLKDGRILAEGAPDEFRKSSEPYVQKFLAGEPLEGEAP